MVGGGDIQESLAQLVRVQVSEQAVVYTEKLEYWKNEMNKSIETKFNEHIDCLNGQLTQLQSEVNE